MKHTLTTLLFLAMSTTVPPAFAVDNSISALCRAGAPEAYSRAGGYCEQVASNRSLLDGKRSKCGRGLYWDESSRECVEVNS